MQADTYRLSQVITIHGKPFHPGGVSKLQFRPGVFGLGIRFILDDQCFFLNNARIQARSQSGARFNEIIFHTFTIKVREHWQSAIRLALGAHPDIDIVVPRIAKPLHWALGGNIMLPYAGGGIANPYNILVKNRELIDTMTYKELKIDQDNAALEQSHPTTNNGITIYREGQTQSITLIHSSGAKLRISNSPNKTKVTVHQANHPDVPQLHSLQIDSFSTDYSNLTIEMLGARALGRTTNPLQYLGAELLRLSGGYGISSEGYFFANPLTSANQLQQKMHPAFQKGSNEHLVHSAIADIPSELILLEKHFGVDLLGLHFEFRDGTHLSRVDLLRAACDLPCLETNTNMHYRSLN